MNSYFYTKVLNDGEEDVILHEGPIKIVASCSENTAQIALTLLNVEEDMVVFGFR